MSFCGSSLNCPTSSISQSTPPSPSSQSHPNAEVTSFAKHNWASSAHQPQLYLATLPTVIPANEAGSSKSLQFSRPKRKRITPEQLEVLSNLFEYTDTPTFDLREAIGSKLGMSNREVQVWFQNRRAKVNRQRIPSNSQVLQEKSLLSPISQPQEPSSPSHRRMRSSPTHLLLPGVSSILNSDSCRPIYSAPPLLPPFPVTLPGVDSLQDIPMCLATPDGYSVPTSPPNPKRSDSFFRYSAPMRPSPPGSRRRIRTGTPTSLHSRTSPRCSSPVPSVEDSTRPISPARSGADHSAGMISDSLTSSLATSHWNSGSSCTSWSLTDSRSVPQARPTVTTPPHGWAPTDNEGPIPTKEKQVPYHPPYFSTSRSSSEIFRYSQPLGIGARSPPVLPMPSQTDHVRETTRFENLESSHSLAPPQVPRPGLTEDAAPPATRSLFASRCLPPLPNPVRPGPGSFPPPPALRVVPIMQDNLSTTPVRSSPNSASEFKLPPLLNGPNDS